MSLEFKFNIIYNISILRNLRYKKTRRGLDE
nr:MAG TPA: hypothetical protein [Caudoviricetes sp.]